MLARPTEPTSSEIARDEPSAGSSAVRGPDAFGRARRHSRHVRVLKFVLPVIAGAIAVAFPVYSYVVAPASIEVKADGSAFADGKLVMANPKLDGFTKQNLRYSMTAVRAIQDVANGGVIQLEGIDARLPISADNVAAVDAARGTYDRDGNTLNLTSDITVKTTDGMIAKFKSVYLDMGKGLMKTDDPVDISNDGSRIRSDSMTVEDNGKVLIFDKRVRVNIDPAKLQSAKQQSGDKNAVQ